MTDWKTVHDGRVERPGTIDATSSASTVYERRNIKQETKHDEMSDTDYTEWTYEQREYTQDEYAMMLSPAIRQLQQSISALELSIAEL